MIKDLLLLSPLILTIYIAISKKDVILALYSGVFIGIIILAKGNIVTSFNMLFGTYLLGELTDSYNARSNNLNSIYKWFYTIN